MAPLPKDLGQKLLLARGEQIRAIVRAVVGSDAPLTPALPDPKISEKAKLFPLRGDPRARGEAVQAAAAVLEGFLSRQPAAIEKHAHAQLWMMWPDGKIARHETPALLEAVEKSEGKDAPLIIEDKLSYNAGELRSVLPRGVPEAIERMLGISNAIAVTMKLESRSGPAGYAMVLLSPGEDGKMRAHNLLLPSIDVAVRANTVPSNSDDDAVRFADRIVRHFVLGHDRQLKSLRNHFGERVVFGEEVLAPEKIVELAGKDAHRADALDVVFGGARLVKLEELGPNGDRVKRRAQEYWKRPYEKLILKAIAVRAGERDVHAIMMKVMTGPSKDEERHQLAALFM